MWIVHVIRHRGVNVFSEEFIEFLQTVVDLANAVFRLIMHGKGEVVR
jgi:hypothetical protein